MSALEITSMSTKGQIVIPNEIRTELNVQAGTKFIVLTDGKNILLKPIEKPKMNIFDDLVEKSKEYVKKNNIKQSSLKSLIKRVRSEDRT